MNVSGDSYKAILFDLRGVRDVEIKKEGGPDGTAGFRRTSTITDFQEKLSGLKAAAAAAAATRGRHVFVPSSTN